MQVVAWKKQTTEGNQINLIEKATIIDYHRHRIDRFRCGSVESLGWRGTESQEKRFGVLHRIGGLTGASLLDVGCGHGDLKGFLDRTVADFVYVGIDNMPEFIAEAQNRYGAMPDTHFFPADFATATLPEADYVIASGALSYRCASPHFHLGMIEKMFGAARKAVAFNMLVAGRFPDHPLLIGHDPDRVLSFCRQLSPNVERVDGYLDDDFTILMHKTCKTCQQSSGKTGVDKIKNAKWGGDQCCSPGVSPDGMMIRKNKEWIVTDFLDQSRQHSNRQCDDGSRPR